MSEARPGTVIAGKYRLLEPISEGGMGSVWRAHHTQLDAPVAIKFMRAELLDNEGLRARFSREAKSAAQIRSPHVVHVYDHGFDDSGAPFIVMEVLEGEDLGKRLKGNKKLTPDELLRICRQVCKGLSRAHEAGIIHRDLKPANIFLSKPDDDMAKILDFGIAKDTTGTQRVVGGAATTVGQVLGSPQYMSPEQAKGGDIDKRSDLWSLAVIVYRALTGRLPFLGEDVAVLVQICTEKAPPPSSLNGLLGARVDLFFERAFDRDPDRRYQSAAEFVTELEAALASEPARRDNEDEFNLPSPNSAPAPARPDMELPRAPATYLRQARVHAPASRSPWTGWVAIGAGVAIAGAIILWVWGKPGDLPIGAATDAVDDVMGKLRDAVGEGGASAGKDAGTPLTPEQARAKLADETWATLFRQVKLHEIPEAVATLETLATIDPDSADSKRNTLMDLAEQAFARHDQTSERMAALLTSKLGSHGPDLLFDLVVLRPDGPAAEDARRFLADAELRQRGSKDMQLAYAIHQAHKCSKRAQVLRAKQDGGERVLREVRPLLKRCAAGTPCCLAGDAAVAAVITAIESRVQDGPSAR